jgi:hypothetical protein
VPVDQAGEDIGKVGLRLELVELARLDEGSQDSPVLAAAVGAGEQSFFAVQCDGPVSGRLAPLFAVLTGVAFRLRLCNCSRGWRKLACVGVGSLNLSWDESSPIHAFERSRQGWGHP